MSSCQLHTNLIPTLSLVSPPLDSFCAFAEGSLVAAGFDAADGDQLGGCFVTPPCYAQMTHMLMGLARGKLVVCLEVRAFQYPFRDLPIHKLTQ